MGSSEKFCLRWNDFESNISIAFREIREEKDFFDCTLSCGSRQIQAHKLILSACSPFFRSILRQNPHQHPLLYLKGVEFTDLQAVLNFMYHGEVNVAQEELNSFLSVAEDLQVKGLTQNESSQSKPKPEPISSRPKPVKGSRAPVTPYVASASTQPTYQDDQDDIQEVVPVVKSEPESYNTQAPPSEPVYPPQTAQVKYQPPPPAPAPLPSQQPMGELVQTMDDSTYGYGDDGYDYGGYEGDEGYDGAAADQMELDTSKGIGLDMANIESFISEGEKGFICELCGKCLGKFRQSCKRHIKLVHMNQGNKIKCGSCDQLFKNRESLKTHERKWHNIYASGY